ncbi:TlpA disulfide reductase family protein [Bacteroides acidifaciens]|uniref:TlpA family protein disulfide reductase n=1 Tax=Bacteroides acidifaciens TaxID=85831 RepID=UPI0026F2999D|nr:TlpA disulfide reductase family protein [Bacteroides acidifaciens]
MKFRAFILFGIMVFYSFSIYADENIRSIVLKLDTLEHYKEFRHQSICIPRAVKIWGEGKLEPDSILYEMSLQKKEDMTCGTSPLTINILVEKKEKAIQVSVLKRLNRIVENDIILLYHVDSLNVWGRNLSVPRVEINVPFCINNEVQTECVDIYLIPSRLGVNFHNEQVQALPLLISMERCRKANFEGHTFYFAKDDYVKMDEKAVRIYISKGGVYHADEYVHMNGTKMDKKEVYHLGDTVQVNEHFYKLCCLTENWKRFYMREIIDIDTNPVEKLLPAGILEKLNPFFDEEKEYMLIDFWGTWCNPCIKGLPELKNLYESIRNEYGFVSVCFDEPDNFEKAKRIFEAQHIAWKQMFEDVRKGNDTITRSLKINTFPSVVLIDRKGKIMFQGKGQKGFEELKKLLFE